MSAMSRGKDGSRKPVAGSRKSGAFELVDAVHLISGYRLPAAGYRIPGCAS